MWKFCYPATTAYCRNGINAIYYPPRPLLTKQTDVLTTRSREAWDSAFNFINCSEIGRAPRQHHCRDVCQSVQRYDDYNTQSRTPSYRLVNRGPVYTWLPDEEHLFDLPRFGNVSIYITVVIHCRSLFSPSWTVSIFCFCPKLKDNIFRVRQIMHNFGYPLSTICVWFEWII